MLAERVSGGDRVVFGIQMTAPGVEGHSSEATRGLIGVRTASSMANDRE
jgi:hypothetical protein